MTGQECKHRRLVRGTADVKRRLHSKRAQGAGIALADVGEGLDCDVGVVAHLCSALMNHGRVPGPAERPLISSLIS